jgi:hypothetical protein
MSNVVQVTRYRAKDGSLHDNPAQADAHDLWVAKEQLQSDVRTTIREDLDNFGRSRIPHWRDLEDYEQRHIEEDIVDMFINNFEKLAAIPALKRKLK